MVDSITSHGSIGLGVGLSVKITDTFSEILFSFERDGHDGDLDEECFKF
jgi:hypothetical protein